MPELMQLLTGISISRYLPATGTAGFARVLVRGYSREPCPPPRMIASTFFIFYLDYLGFLLKYFSECQYCLSLRGSLQVKKEHKDQKCKFTLVITHIFWEVWGTS